MPERLMPIQVAQRILEKLYHCDRSTDFHANGLGGIRSRQTNLRIAAHGSLDVQ